MKQSLKQQVKKLRNKLKNIEKDVRALMECDVYRNEVNCSDKQKHKIDMKELNQVLTSGPVQLSVAGTCVCGDIAHLCLQDPTHFVVKCDKCGRRTNRYTNRTNAIIAWEKKIKKIETFRSNLTSMFSNICNLKEQYHGKGLTEELEKEISEGISEEDQSIIDAQR